MIGAILAGGKASRIGGGDKGVRHVGGRAILARIAAVLQGQCERVILNASGDPARFAAAGIEGGWQVVPDEMSAGEGPLAGVLATLDFAARTYPDIPFVLTVPTDTPFLPSDLLARLQDARTADRASIVCAKSGGRVHHTIAIWAVELRHDLRRALVEDGLRKVGAFIARHPFAVVAWPVIPFDPFLNVNTSDDLAAAERIAASLSAASSQGG